MMTLFLTNVSVVVCSLKLLKRKFSDFSKFHNSSRLNFYNIYFHKEPKSAPVTKHVIESESNSDDDITLKPASKKTLAVFPDTSFESDSEESECVFFYAI
ncbi:hypothetical protein HK096_005021 [Nowakowskiella sp. JEL0078]|nr:hypothetical protein HK096_005021 [Nowakowskiella sp. JEL0078]